MKQSDGNSHIINTLITLNQHLKTELFAQFSAALLYTPFNVTYLFISLSVLLF